MKSYTDLEQSRKLAEILPLESADMCYLSDESLVPKVIYSGMAFFDSKEERPTNIIHCWSLAALYSILPNNKKETTTLSRGGWKIEPVEYLDNWWCEYEDENHTKDFTVSADNPVDACVEMIIRLNELNLL